MPARKYSDELLNEAAVLREAGMSTPSIARRLGMSIGSVYWHCLRLGADTPNPGKPQLQGPMSFERSGHVVRRFTPAEDAKLVAMDARGARICTMCRAVGRTPNSVKARLMTLARRDARAEARQEAETCRA